jgi:uncharacterized protein (TIGR03086 family)
MEQWELPTPCPEWDVRALVNHVVGGNVRYTMLLHGAGEAELSATRDLDHLSPDPASAYERTANEVVAAFSEDGALNRTVHHPAGDRSGLDLLGMRILELGVHGWDVARAVGVDETMDPGIVTYLWDWTATIDEATSRRFFGGVGDDDPDAPLQDRLLRRVGRRP